MAITKSLSIEDTNLAERSIVSAREQVYSDIDLSFAKKSNGDIFKKTEAAAVKQAVKTLIQTNFGERPFNYYFGSNIRALLFEPMNPITEQRMKDEVTEAVKRHEPRAQVIGVTVDGQEDQNRYVVKILFNLSSEAEPQELETYFERV